ncbi:methyltransferase [Spongiibacter sp. KMU-166]|uniref:Methyltransferase n=1 Tax=Spongiibacter thalassae TaxID=2721624 RepID=A0ABX1GL33_9GAMM|nr:methyltransferase domain-containing protein [Spongiibacter thalassae]NKI19113.1 methyltransferase [Spongiibacter thalassae]
MSSDNDVLKNIRIVHDIFILKKQHKLIRRMQRALAEPEIHGYQVWGSSFLIMDYLLQHPPKSRSKITEIGCGWGILSIFCAQQFGARMTALDADEHVFPYLDAHALLNDVEITTRVAKYQELTTKDLKGHKMVLGGDICFWPKLVAPLFTAIETALEAGVEKIIIADPGRPTFHKLARKCQKHFNAELLDWKVSTPKTISGELLVVQR